MTPLHPSPTPSPLLRQTETGDKRLRSGQDQTTKPVGKVNMATDGGSWNNLPSVILLEVFKYLPRNDTISASSTCKQWRQHLYHATLWRNLTFKINSHDEDTVARSRYLASCFSKKLRSATVKFDSLDPVCVEEAARVVKKLSKNTELRKFHLMPSNCHSEYSGRCEALKQFCGR